METTPVHIWLFTTHNINENNYVGGKILCFGLACALVHYAYSQIIPYR